MLIHQVAKESNLPIATIRYYEKYGLIKGKKKAGKTTNNYSLYDDEVLEKLELIIAAKQVGFSLAEIKALLDSWYNKRFTKQKKIQLLNDRLAFIDNKILQLNEMKQQIRVFIQEVSEYDC